MAGKQAIPCAIKEKNNYARVFDTGTCRHVTAVNVNGKIHIFDGNVRKMIVRCPGTPNVFDLHKDRDGQWQIWVATRRGNVYRKVLQFVCNPGIELMEMDSGSNQTIFDDLLKDGATEVSDFNIGHHKPPSQDLCEICDENKVLSCHGEVICVFCVEDFVAVVCRDRSEVVLIYPINELQSGTSPDVAFRLPLPYPHEKNGLCRFSELNIVVSENTKCLSSSQVCVPSHLFSLLFGWEMSVRSLPIVVCSMTDGSVYFHSVDLTICNPEPTWQLLCRVDSPVVDVLSVKLNRTLSEQESVAAELHSALGFSVRTPSHSKLDAFLVVGVSGKCCVISAMPTLGSAAYSSDCYKMVTVFALSGSVDCVCCHDDVLYSCGPTSSIQKCLLTVVQQEGRERKQFSVDVKTQHLFSASVSVMWFSGRENTLLCQTVNRDFIEIDCTPSASDAGNTKTLLQPALKDLLLGVDVSQAKLDELKSIQMQYNSFLQQMNVASRLLQQNNHTHVSGSLNASPISCKVSVQSEIGYHSVNYYLVLEVSNHSTVTLTKDWSLIAVLNETNGRHHFKLAESELSSSHSFRLSEELGAQCRIHFRIPVTYSPVCCGLKIDVSLILHVPEVLQKGNCELESFRNSCLFVPLATAVVDVFHFLHLKQTGSALPLSLYPLLLEKQVAELKHDGQSKCHSDKKIGGMIYSVSERISASVEDGFSTPVETLRTFLTDSQVKTELLVHASCTLQAPCGSVLTMAVELCEGDKVCAITMKSADISLLARARLALTKKLQNVGSKHSDVSVEEFRKMIQKTELFQQQLQEIQDKFGKGDNTPRDTLTELCSLYEMMKSDAV